MVVKLDLVGRVFGRLTVLSETPNSVRRRWACLCECGSSKDVAQQELMSGQTKSCGCLHREAVIARNTTHGHSTRKNQSYTYKKWKGMHARTVDTKSLKNACYIGVDVCPEWSDYSVFLSDMGECPTGHSLDRIDNNKGYSPDNCRWVPLAMQAANTSRNVNLVIEGMTVHVSEAARRAGLDPDVVFDRVNKLGWSIDDAINTPLLRSKTKTTPHMVEQAYAMCAAGESQKAAAQKLGVSQGWVSLALKRRKESEIV